MSKLYWAKVKKEAIIPTKRREDAGYDLYPCFEQEYLEIAPAHTQLVPLGIASAFDSDYVMILKERGSTGTKGMAQRAGVIDSGYRGEYMAPITNVNDKPVVIAKADVVDQFDDSTIRRLVNSIHVTHDLELIIYIKGGYEIREKYLPLTKSA